MNADFWHKKWQENQIGFHEGQPNELLVNNFAKLAVQPNGRIFLPLCGKTVDIDWFLQQGFKTVGAELSEIAIEQLFDDLALTPKIVTIGNLKHYQAKNIDIFVGDIFDITSDVMGQIDAVYDRAAMVALPEQVRIKYAKHMIDITDTAPQLLICYEYDQGLMNGPPFSVSGMEIKQNYAQHYNIGHVDAVRVEQGGRGKANAIENVWLLEAK